MPAANEKRKVMVQMFEQASRPTMYLASHANNIVRSKAETFELDIVRGSRQVAVDITPGAGGRPNSAGKYSSKEYNPPFYDEYFAITAAELQKRMPGQTMYQAADTSYDATRDAYFVRKQVIVKDKILRAMELQARDAFFSGKITLADATVIDFNKKTSHDITPTKTWDDADGDPIANLTAACELIRKDGMINSSRFKLDLAGDAMEALIGNDDIKNRANFRRVDLIEMSVGDINTEGAVPHGVMTAGSYTIELWTYPSVYEDASGTTQDYIPSGRGLLTPTSGLRIDQFFGGVPEIVQQIDPRTSMLMQGLTMQEADFMPYTMLDPKALCINAGVRSRPLFVPHQIDGFVTFTDLVT